MDNLNSIRQEGQKSYQAIRPNSRVSEVKKSTKHTITALVGMASLGKYTLEIKLELPIRLFEKPEKALEKNCQGRPKTRMG